MAQVRYTGMDAQTSEYRFQREDRIPREDPLELAALFTAAPDLLAACKLAAAKAGNATARLAGSRPHPNDVEWAKTILADIIIAAGAAIAEAETEAIS